MEKVSTSVLKNKLSAYLHRVEAGKGFFVTDRGQPIAALVPLDQVQPVEREAMLAALAKSGRVLLPSGKRAASGLPAVRIKGVEASQMIVRDRR